MNFLDAEGRIPAGAETINLRGTSIAMPKTHSEHGHNEAVLGVRPENIVISDQGDLRGSVFAVEYMGSRQLITVDTDAGRIRVRAPNQVRADAGETVGLSFRTENLIVFDPISDKAIPSELFAKPSTGGTAHG